MNEQGLSVGVGVVVENIYSEVLLGLRKGSHAAGQWCLPGGSTESGETPAFAAQRELQEETGIKPSWSENLTQINYWTLDTFETGRTWVTVYYRYQYSPMAQLLGTINVQVVEPDKCEEWRWFDPMHLPEKLMSGTDKVLRHLYMKET